MGGFILFEGDIYESAVLIDRLQSQSPIPLLIDFRLRAGSRLPHSQYPSPALEHGCGGTPGSEQWGLAIGKDASPPRKLEPLGVNWIFAPVVDVNNNPSNPVINIRAYGEEPAKGRSPGRGICGRSPGRPEFWRRPNTFPATATPRWIPICPCRVIAAQRAGAWNRSSGFPFGRRFGPAS